MTGLQLAGIRTGIEDQFRPARSLLLTLNFYNNRYLSQLSRNQFFLSISKTSPLAVNLRSRDSNVRFLRCDGPFAALDSDRIYKLHQTCFLVPGSSLAENLRSSCDKCTFPVKFTMSPEFPALTSWSACSQYQRPGFFLGDSTIDKCKYKK